MSKPRPPAGAADARKRNARVRTGISTPPSSGTVKDEATAQPLGYVEGCPGLADAYAYARMDRTEIVHCDGCQECAKEHVPTEPSERAAKLEKAAREMDKALGMLFWTSDDGDTTREGTPDDEDAPSILTDAWKLLRAALEGR